MKKKWWKLKGKDMASDYHQRESMKCGPFVLRLLSVSSRQESQVRSQGTGQ